MKALFLLMAVYNFDNCRHFNIEKYLLDFSFFFHIIKVELNSAETNDESLAIIMDFEKHLF